MDAKEHYENNLEEKFEHTSREDAKKLLYN
jgi:hypothetical protein